MNAVGSAAELAERLRGTGYLADDGLATVGYLALALHRPLLLEGEPGTARPPSPLRSPKHSVSS